MRQVTTNHNNQPVHQLAGVGWVGDDRVRFVAVGIDRKRVLAGADVAAIDASQLVRFQMPNQIAIAGARFGESANATQVRDQGRHSSPWCRIEVGFAAFEVRSFAHQRSTLISASS